MHRFIAVLSVPVREAIQHLRWPGALLALALIALLWALVWLAVFPPPGVEVPSVPQIIGLCVVALLLTGFLGNLLFGWRRYSGPDGLARFEARMTEKHGAVWHDLRRSRRLESRAWRMVTLFNIFGTLLLALLPVAAAGAYAHAQGWI